MPAAQDLIESIREGSLDKVKSLLDAEPSLVNSRTPLGASATAYAAYCGHEAIALLLRDRGANIDFWTACTVGDDEQARQLLAADPALIHQHAPDGFTALGLACFFGHSQLARHLLDLGADPNLTATDSMKLAPIHAAIARGNRPLVELLIERGADVNIRQQAGLSPLHSAAAGGHQTIAGLLIAHGADLSATMNGKTPEELAGERGHAGLSDYLRTRGATA